MIVTDDLTKKFDDFLAVDRVSLNVAPGEVLALLGPNGAGKTTTVRMLTSILRPSSGTAHVAGYDVVLQSQKVRASVGVLTEMHGLYDRMPAIEYLDFFGQLYQLTPSVRKQRILNLLEKFSLMQDAHRRIGEYSKGMRQKLALARALLHQPPVLLLDEPTSAMDPESARLVRDALHDLRSTDRSIVICTHNLAEAEELADQIAIIRKGRIIASGTSDGLKAEMLGPTEFEMRLGEMLNGHTPNLPLEVQLTSRGEDWLRYRVDQPEILNPVLLRSVLEQGYPVIGLKEVSRSLEEAYLQAVSTHDQSLNGGVENVG